MKKAVITALLISTATPSFAQNFDVYLKFNDNTVVKYENIPGSTDTEQFRSMVARQHPDKTGIIDARVIPVVESPRTAAVMQQTPTKVVEEETSFWDSGWGTATKVLVAGFLLYKLSKAIPISSGPCDYAWQTARDGSRCGNRAASVRPGGR